ncbi:MAG: hypothetical protein ABIU18_01070, partial [Novosphingobium sp.]
DGGGGARRKPSAHASVEPPPQPLPAGEGLEGKDEAAQTLAYRIGLTQALDRLLLTGASITPLRDWTVPQFPLKGRDIIARGVAPGQEVAHLLREIEDRWVAEGFPGVDRVWEILAGEVGNSGK